MAKFPSLEIPAVKRSNKKLSHVNRYTTQPGLLNVCYVQMCVPGDQFKIRPYLKVETLPLKAPLYGRFAVQTDFYFVPFRLYRSDMRSNQRKLFISSGQSMDYILPTFKMDGAFTNIGVSSTTPGAYNIGGLGIIDGQTNDGGKMLACYAVKNNSLLNQLGFPIGFMDGSTGNTALSVGGKGNKEYFGHLLLAYYDIFRNYYANTQEANFYVRRARFMNSSAHVPITEVSLATLDSLYTQSNPNSQTIYDYFFSVNKSAIDQGSDMFRPRVAMEGLCYRTYKPDYFSNWINKGAYDTIASSFGKIVTSTSGNNESFTVNQFRLANRLMKRGERILAAGGRYGDYIRALFTINTNPELDIPEFIGGSLTYLDFQSIQSQVGGSTEYDPTSGKYPLGASASKGNMIDSLSTLNVTCDDYGYIIGINSIIPTPDYSQGVPREFTNKYLSDFYDPTLDRVGFQAIYKSEFVATLDKSSDQIFKYWGASNHPDPFAESSAVAYQPAYMEMETRTNRNYGLLGIDAVFPNGQQGNLNFWTLNRNFYRPDYGSQSSGARVFSASTYVTPSDYSVSFVDDSFDAQNFIIQYNFDVKAKRPKSKKMMPNLG